MVPKGNRSRKQFRNSFASNLQLGILVLALGKFGKKGERTFLLRSTIIIKSLKVPRVPTTVVARNPPRERFLQRFSIVLVRSPGRKDKGKGPFSP